MIEYLTYIVNGDYWKLFDAGATFLSAYVIVYGAIKLFNLQNLFKFYYYNKFDKNTIIVLGLGNETKTYIDSELKSKNKIIVIEHNKDNIFINSYMKTENVSVLIANPTEQSILQKLNLKTKKHIIISLGNDMNNLEVVSQILNCNINTKIYVHIEDRNLRHFHKENGLLKGSNIKIYSYYEDTSRALFDKYDVDGDNNTIIQSNELYSIVIVGNTSLAYEVIAQACIMGQLPHENKLFIYCLDQYPEEFKKSIDLNYTEIHNIPNIELKYIKLDCNSKDFYEQDIWYKKNLTNIILCFKDEQLNLSIAANLANITYLSFIEEKQLETKILIAMFNDYNFSNNFESNDEYFRNFFVFGQKEKICTKEYLIDEIRDIYAKATNEIYNENNSKEKIKKWEELSYHEKESNRASADHIKIKQKYLKIDSSDEAKELLAKCEHNRWNAYHFLNGWKYNENTNKSKKLHNCLIDYKYLNEKTKDYDRDMVLNIKRIVNWKLNEN